MGLKGGMDATKKAPENPHHQTQHPGSVKGGVKLSRIPDIP